MQWEKRVVRFLDSIAGDADELYLLGDILDYWYEYRNVAPRGYVRFFGALARMADRGTKIHWFIGNHDIWLFDYLRNEIGLEVVDGYEVRMIRGKKFFLTHGDGVGQLKPTFRFLRAMFRNRLCQKPTVGLKPPAGMKTIFCPNSRGKIKNRWLSSARNISATSTRRLIFSSTDTATYCWIYR